MSVLQGRHYSMKMKRYSLFEISTVIHHLSVNFHILILFHLPNFDKSLIKKGNAQAQQEDI